MKEKGVRKFHRTLGIIVVWFLAGQALTGLVLTISHLWLNHSHSALLKFLGTLHYGWDPLGGFYRILLALATLTQGISGVIIYFMIRARTPKA